MPNPTHTTDPTETPTPYDRAALFHDHGPFHPSFQREAIRALLRTLPIDPAEPKGWADRRMFAALLALSALHPRDEIEVMLGIQAVAAYHAAAAGFHLGMNLATPKGTGTRHLTAACSAARTFDALLRALERRQAKPLAVPIGRPAPQAWDGPHPSVVIDELADRVRADADPPKSQDQPSSTAVWSPEDLAFAERFRQQERIEQDNQGLDIANTEGILPCGGMILTEDPTPQQQAYMARRLKLMYQREYAENLRNGIREYPKIRPIRPGDLIP